MSKKHEILKRSQKLQLTSNSKVLCVVVYVEKRRRYKTATSTTTRWAVISEQKLMKHKTWIITISISEQWKFHWESRLWWGTFFAPCSACKADERECCIKRKVIYYSNLWCLWDKNNVVFPSMIPVWRMVKHGHCHIGTKILDVWPWRRWKSENNRE